MSAWITNGATVLELRASDFQVQSTPKRKAQRLINNTAKLPVVMNISDATDRLLTAEISMPPDDKGTYAGADSLVSFFESDDPNGVDRMARTFMFTNSDGTAYQCRFADGDLGGGLRRSKKPDLYTGSFRLLVEHTLPTDESTGPLLWLAAYDMDANGGDLSAWSNNDAVGDTGAEWEDLSGNDVDGLQGTAADRPLWKTSQINSRPAVDFISSDFLTVDGIAATFDGQSDTAWSAYLVFDADTFASEDTALGVGDSAAVDDRINFFGTGYGGGNNTWGLDIHDDTTPVEVAGDVGDTDDHVVAVICAGTTVSAWLDGDNMFTDTAFNVGQIDVDKGRIGCEIVQNTEAQFWDGRIAEVILFSGQHTTLQRRRQEFRLADMSGITLAA